MADPEGPGPLIDRIRRWIQDHALAVAGGGAVAAVAAVTMAIALASGGPEDPASPSATTAQPDPGSPASDVSGPTGTATTLPAGEAASLIGVKIDNAEPARPHIGLDAARVVIETPVEGGVTRFLAFFPPGDTLVGPVRSARPVDVDLVGLMSDTLVSTGGRPFVLGELTGNGVVLVGHDPLDSPFQALERPSPHNLFISLNEVTPGAEVRSGIPFGDLPATGEPVDVLEVPYPTPVTWTHTDGGYARAEGGEGISVLPSFDAEPQPFVVDTVVVMAVNERSAGYQDANDVEVSTFDVIGSERLWVYHQGTSVAGTWSRASLTDGYAFRSAEGDLFELPQGRTFIHLLPRHLLDG